MTPDRLHSDTVGRGSPLQPLLLRSEISLFWCTSCARDFLDTAFFQFTVTRVFLISDMILLGEVMKWNPKIPMVSKNQNWKKSWVIPLYLGTAVYLWSLQSDMMRTKKCSRKTFLSEKRKISFRMRKMEFCALCGEKIWLGISEFFCRPKVEVPESVIPGS